MAVRGGNSTTLKVVLLVSIVALGLSILITAWGIPKQTASSLGSAANVHMGMDPGAVMDAEVQGVHHHLSVLLTNAAGKQLAIDDVVVGTDRITVLFHATGVKSIPFSQLAQDPLYQTEPPTLIQVLVDGASLVPIDAQTEGEQGGTRWGYIVVGWAGGTPHHVHISVERIEGDLQAKWVADSDL
jgi:hypothetical protein